MKKTFTKYVLENKIMEFSVLSETVQEAVKAVYCKEDSFLA